MYDNYERPLSVGDFVAYAGRPSELLVGIVTELPPREAAKVQYLGESSSEEREDYFGISQLLKVPKSGIPTCLRKRLFERRLQLLGEEVPRFGQFEYRDISGNLMKVGDFVVFISGRKGTVPRLYFGVMSWISNNELADVKYIHVHLKSIKKEWVVDTTQILKVEEGDLPEYLQPRLSRLSRRVVQNHEEMLERMS